MSEILIGKDMRKEFVMGDTVVKALNGTPLSINEGEFVVILGPSGSGKSTTLNIIGGIDTLTGGELYFRDIAVHSLSRSKLVEYRRKYIGFVFQFYNLIPNINVYENVNLAAQMSDNPLDPKELIDRVGLTQRIDYYPSKMSGGQQQRVAIARALCKNPDLLLCDEPTGALDSKTSVEILDLLCDFNHEYKKTVIIVTHNADIAQLANRVIYFRDGGIERVVTNEHPLKVSEVNW